MSHIHIPDGVLPLWLWAAGWVLALGLVTLAGRVGGRTEARRKVPLLAVVTALVLVSMASEIVPIAYHVNLTVVAGALLGPWLGIVSAFISVVVLALVGHGGVTVIGLNTLVIAAEVVLGGVLFRGLVRLLGRHRVPVAAAVATVLTLAVTTTALVGIVALAGDLRATSRETGALDPASLRFSSPFGEGVFRLGPERAEEPAAEDGGVSVQRFARIVYTLGPIGWLIEALVTAAVLGYVARVRPSVLFPEGPPPRGRHPGDEQGGR